MRSNLFISALLSATVMAGSASLAAEPSATSADAKFYSSVKALPEQGPVTIVGTVQKSTSDANSFTLVDEQGKSIDVNTNTNISFNEGERVKVDGMAESKFLGLSREINQANASSLSDLAPASGKSDKDSSRMDDQSNNTTRSDNKGISSMTGMTGVRADNAPNDKVQNSPDKVPSYDIDADASKDTKGDGDTLINVDADVKQTQSLKDAKEAAESTTHVKPKQISN